MPSHPLHVWFCLMAWCLMQFKDWSNSIVDTEAWCLPPSVGRINKIWFTFYKTSIYVWIADFSSYLATGTLIQITLTLTLIVLVCACFYTGSSVHGSRHALIGVCWLASICTPAGNTSTKSLCQCHTHTQIRKGAGPGPSVMGTPKWVSVCYWKRGKMGGRRKEREKGGSGQAALTLRCLRPKCAIDPVSNSPLLAVLMPASTSYHTICSGDSPALLGPAPTHSLPLFALWWLGAQPNNATLNAKYQKIGGNWKNISIAYFLWVSEWVAFCNIN